MSRRHLQLALLAIILLAVPIFAYDKCIHDTSEHPEPEEIDPVTDNVDAEGRILADATYPNLRVKPYYGSLGDDDLNFKNYVQNALIPPIVSYFQGALRVKYPLGSVFSFGQPSICGGIGTPDELRSGVVGDIYWVIVGASDQSSWLADSYACNLMSASKRPYIARTKINKYMFGATSDILGHEKNIVCIMHEFTHVLGFSYSLFFKFRDASGGPLTYHIETHPLSGVDTQTVNVEPLTSKLRAHFGCSTLVGAYMENTGGSGTTGSHFERRQFANEMMTSGMIYEMAVSQFTLAMLEGSGWYTANYSYAEPHTFGQGQGCDFLTGDCSPDEFSEFCNGAVRGCTTAGLSGGKCAADIRSDGCRFQHANYGYHCENSGAGFNARFPNLEVFGRGAGSKCFDGTLTSMTEAPSACSFCFKYQCIQPKAAVLNPNTGSAGASTPWQLQVSLGNTTVTCQKAGDLSVPGFQGALKCPDPQEYCTTVGAPVCPRNCMGRGDCINGVCQCQGGFTGKDCALGPKGLQWN